MDGARNILGKRRPRDARATRSNPSSGRCVEYVIGGLLRLCSCVNQKLAMPSILA